VGEVTRTSGLDEAVMWIGTGDPVGLGFLPGMNGSAALAVSADGSAAVGERYTGAEAQAFFWTSADGFMIRLESIAGGSPITFARAISADGSSVVGGTGAANPGEAFRWTAYEGMVGLGHVPGTTISDAFGVSGDGSIVVGNSQSGAPAF